MPLVTRYFIRTALLFFVLALFCALLLGLRFVVDLPRFVAALTPVYFHLFMVGWVTQIIIGVAYWMFPVYTKEKPRGSAYLAWATYLLLNVGLVIRVIAEPGQAVQAGSLWGKALALSALIQWLGGLAFVVNTWPRVRAR